MVRRIGHLLAFAAVCLGSIALAEDEVYLKAKAAKSKGVIVAESSQRVVFKSGAKFAAEDIDDILYEWPVTGDVTASLAYINAFNSERTWLATTDAKKRAKEYANALDAYERAYQKSGDKKIKAHLDFKLGFLRGKKALEDNSDAKPAIARLREFATKNPNSWQVARALMLLAKLQSDGKDFVGAEQSFAEIAKLDVSDDVKNDARLQGALVNIQLGRIPTAEAKLNELLKTLPKGSKSYARALLAQSECLFAGKKPAEAVASLKQALKESPVDDKTLRATAYNSLGAYFYDSDQLKEARWEFLWVDVVYNQDKHEHARALYYLSHIFDKTGDSDKAAQCRALLLEPAFAGTEFQRKLQKEQAK
jgi:predicted negative regulator of RcsB-dependent stress response